MYSQNLGSSTVNINSRTSTLPNFGSALNTFVGVKDKLKDSKAKSAVGKVAGAATGLVAANELANSAGFKDMFDVAAKGASALKTPVENLAGAVGASAEQVGKAGGVVDSIKGALDKASTTYQSSRLGKITPIRDTIDAFKGITNKGAAIQGPLTDAINEVRGTEGQQTYLEELGLGTLAALGVLGAAKGVKSLVKRKMYTKDRAVEHKHDIDLAKELKNTDTDKIEKHNRSKDLKLSEFQAYA